MSILHSWNILRNNLTLEDDSKDYYISFNESEKETALVKKESLKNKFYILNGDFRSEYEEVFEKGFEECLKVFEKYKEEHESCWSGKD